MALDLHADADFTGLWNSEDIQDPTCVKSRTGYLLTLGGSPLLWASKLQPLIALATLESEYISLSTGMRELIPARRLFAEMSEVLKIDTDKVSSVSAVYEDNHGCIKVASKGPVLTPRTKHIGIRYHWF